jgi:hypothetical protein
MRKPPCLARYEAVKIAKDKADTAWIRSLPFISSLEVLPDLGIALATRIDEWEQLRRGSA